MTKFCGTRWDTMVFSGRVNVDLLSQCDEWGLKGWQTEVRWSGWADWRPTQKEVASFWLALGMEHMDSPVYCREATFPVFHWNGETYREHREVISIWGPFLWLRCPDLNLQQQSKEFCYLSKLPERPSLNHWNEFELSEMSLEVMLSAPYILKLTCQDGMKQLCLSDQDNLPLKNIF